MNGNETLREEFTDLVNGYTNGSSTPDDLRALWKICASLKGCTDQLPGSTARDLNDLHPPLPRSRPISTYAEGARAVREHVKLTGAFGTK